MLSLRLALDLGRGRTLDAQVMPPVVEQRHRVMRLVRERVHATDEQVVVAGREGLDDRALERRDRTIEQWQTRLARLPGRPAEVLPAGLDRCPREAVGERLLVLGQDVDRVPS